MFSGNACLGKMMMPMASEQGLILQPVMQFTPPPQGVLLRQRPNAVSIRTRRRRDPDNRLSLHNEVEKSTPRRSRAQRFSSEFSTKEFDFKSPSKSEDRTYARNQKLNREWRRQRAYSDEWDRPEPTTFSRSKIERKSAGGLSVRTQKLTLSPGPMETLDRRISASTDQLDTLRKTRKEDGFDDGFEHRSRRMGSAGSSTRNPRPRSATRFALGAERKSHRSSFVIENDDNEFTLNYRGDKVSRSSYFFGSSKKCDRNTKATNNSNEPLKKSNLKGGSGRQKKTAVDIFLEDEGPYSRKLYGPPPPLSSPDEKTNSPDDRQKKRAKSQEALCEVSWSSDETLSTFFFKRKKNLSLCVQDCCMFRSNFSLLNEKKEKIFLREIVGSKNHK